MRLMGIRCSLLALVVALLGFLISPAPAQATDLTGTWLMRIADGQRAVSISQDGDEIRGHLVAAIPGWYEANTQVLRGKVGDDGVTNLQRLSKDREGCALWVDITDVVLSPESTSLDGATMGISFSDDAACTPFRIPTAFRLTRVTETPTLRAVGLARVGDPEQKLNDVYPLQLFRAAVELAPGADATSNDTVTATLRNGRNDEELVVKARRYGDPGSAYYVSDPILLASDGVEAQTHWPQIKGCVGDQITIRAENRRAAFVVVAPDETHYPPPCHQAGPMPRYSLAVVGRSNLLVNPRAGLLPVAKVRLLDDDGEPVVGEPILWHVPERNSAFESFTNENGVAELHFGVHRRGLMQVTVDGIPVGDPLPDRILNDSPTSYYDVEVLPGDPLTSLFIHDGPSNFRVEYVRPTTMRLVEDQTHIEIQDALITGIYFQAEVTLGRLERRTHSGNELDIAITPATGDPITWTAKKGSVRGLFVTEVPKAIATLLSNVPSGNAIKVNQGESVRFTVPGGWMDIGADVNELDRQERIWREIFELASEAALTSLIRGVHEEDMLNLLEQRRKMSVTALELIPDLSSNGRIAVYISYSQFLLAELEEFGALRQISVAQYGDDHDLGGFGARRGHPFPLALRRTTATFHSEREASIVTEAIRRSRSQTFSNIANDMKEVIPDFDRLLSWETLRAVAEAPALGVYTAYTGWTPDGRRAAIAERAAGGTEGLLAVVGGVGVGARLLTLARAARAVVGAGLRKSLSGALRSGSGRPYGVPDAAVSGQALNTIKVRGTATRERLIKTVETSGARYRKRRAELAETRTQLADHRKKLAAMEARRDAAIAAGRGTKTVKARIASKKRKIAQVQARQQRIRGPLAKHRRALQRAQERLGRYDIANIDPDDFRAQVAAGDLPAPRDRVNRLLVQDHYEGQINREVPGYEPGHGVELRSSYHSPLAEGMGTPMSAEGATARGFTHRPVMDHMNPTTLDVADSKYYRFLPEQMAEAGYAERAAREIAETIEKGRAVQMEAIRRMRWDRDLPTDTRSVSHAAQLRSVTIYTPVQVPASIKTMIRQLVGARTSNNLVFRVRRVNAASWLAQ